MKRLFGRITTISLLVLISTPQLASAARPVVQKNQILVTGVVPDRRMVIVDSDLSITQMYSNTNENVTPTVTVGSITGPSIPLSGTVLSQFHTLMGQIKTNKVVSVTLEPNGMPDEYPNFVTLNKVRIYKVKPTVMQFDRQALPYTITNS